MYVCMSCMHVCERIYIYIYIYTYIHIYMRAYTNTRTRKHKHPMDFRNCTCGCMSVCLLALTVKHVWSNRVMYGHSLFVHMCMCAIKHRCLPWLVSTDGRQVAVREHAAKSHPCSGHRENDGKWRSERHSQVRNFLASF